MSEETLQATGPGGEQQSVQVVLDERELKIIFSNAYRIHTTAEEVVIDLGSKGKEVHSERDLRFFRIAVLSD